MSKMKLEVGALEVQSFDAATVPSAHEGTVNGHAKPQTQGCGSEIDACPSSLGCTLFGDCPTALCDTTVEGGCYTSPETGC
ncbi:MAG TPA: hypothetical protein VF665_20765 [Longimicrobium sp.]|uniref:hypothetical protein n=1 Tax=Longimicrobium sp. TaxID=2029185 RepID=UPI002EDA8997